MCQLSCFYHKLSNYGSILHRAPELTVVYTQLRFYAMQINVLSICDDVDNGLDNTCEDIRQETVLFSTPETDYIIYD